MDESPILNNYFTSAYKKLAFSGFQCDLTVYHNPSRRHIAVAVIELCQTGIGLVRQFLTTIYFVSNGLFCSVV
jgi:hypothetical protein